VNVPKFEVTYDVNLCDGKIVVEAATERDAEKMLNEMSPVDVCSHCDLDEIDIIDVCEIE